LVSIFSSIFLAELHKVVTASALPNIASHEAELPPPWNKRNAKTLFFSPCFYLQRKKIEKIWAQNICKNTSLSTH